MRPWLWLMYLHLLQFDEAVSSLQLDSLRREAVTHFGAAAVGRGLAAKAAGFFENHPVQLPGGPPTPEPRRAVRAGNADNRNALPSAYLPKKKREEKTERTFVRQLAERSRFSGFSEPGRRF